MNVKYKPIITLAITALLLFTSIHLQQNSSTRIITEIKEHLLYPYFVHNSYSALKCSARCIIDLSVVVVIIIIFMTPHNPVFYRHPRRQNHQTSRNNIYHF